MSRYWVSLDLGISQSISLPTIPAEPFFPSRPFRVRMATGQGYDDMLRLHEFCTVERPGVDVVAGIGDDVGVQVVLHGGDLYVEVSLDRMSARSIIPFVGNLRKIGGLVLPVFNPVASMSSRVHHPISGPLSRPSGIIPSALSFITYSAESIISSTAAFTKDSISTGNPNLVCHPSNVLLSLPSASWRNSFSFAFSSSDDVLPVSGIK